MMSEVMVTHMQAKNFCTLVSAGVNTSSNNRTKRTNFTKCYEEVLTFVLNL